MTSSHRSAGPLPVPSLHEMLAAAVPDLVGRTVTVECDLAIDARAMCSVLRQHPEPGPRDLPQQAIRALGAWLQGLRNAGVILVGVRTTLEVEEEGPLQPTLFADDVDQLREALSLEIGDLQHGPHDLLIHATATGPQWTLYGLGDLPTAVQRRATTLISDYVQSLAAWLRWSPGSALLIVDAAAHLAHADEMPAAPQAA